MNHLRTFLLAILCAAMLASCTVERKIVGDYNPDSRSVVHSKSHDMYLFWDLVQTRDAEDFVTIKNYQKIVKRTPFDALLFVGSLGFISPYTVVFRVEKDSTVKRDKKPIVPANKVEDVIEK